MVGGSIGWAGRASVTSERAQGVGHGGLGHARRWRRCRPLRRVVARAGASGRGRRSTLVMRPRSISLPSRSSAWMAMPGTGLAALDAAGQQAAQERIAVDQHVARICERLVLRGRALGLRHVADDQVEQRGQVAVRARSQVHRSPSRRGPRRRCAGKSSCSSVAPMAANRSKASFSTRSGRRAGAVDLVDARGSGAGPSSAPCSARTWSGA